MNKFFTAIFLLISVAIQISFAQSWTTFDTSNSPLPSNEIRTIVIDSTNVTWFGTGNGLANLDDGVWNIFKKEEANKTLIDNRINSISIIESDAERFMWIGTENGLTKAQIVNPDSLLFIDNFNQENSGLVNNYVTSSLLDSNSISWFGTDSGASSYNDGHWASYTVDNFWIFFDKITDLAIDQENLVYLATEGNGISRLKIDPVDGTTGASEITTIWAGYNDDEGDGLASDSVYAIYIEPNGHQWYGTNRGLSYHRSNETRKDWDMFDKTNGLSDNFIQAIHRDKNGSMWFGTQNGLTKYDRIKWTTYFKSNGLAGNNILSINSDQQHIWVGTDAGVSRTTIVSGITDDISEKVPRSNSLRNYPNPFNASTIIDLNLSYAGNVVIAVYNVKGQRVRQLARDYFLKGQYKFEWNGRGETGQQLSSGVYFVILNVDGYIDQKLKVLNIK